MSAVARFFALVPAAGCSARMGEPKLLLPWQGRPLIEHVLSAWRATRVDRIVVVIHAPDERLSQSCRAMGVDVVLANPRPVDMKASVQQGLDDLASRVQPLLGDAWLTAPADMPELSAAAIDRLIAAHDPAIPRALIAAHEGRSGHPILIPWIWTPRVSQLGPDEGLDSLLRSMPLEKIECGPPARAADIDTPADFAGLHNRQSPRTPPES